MPQMPPYPMQPGGDPAAMEPGRARRRSYRPASVRFPPDSSYPRRRRRGERARGPERALRWLESGFMNVMSVDLARQLLAGLGLEDEVGGGAHTPR